MRRDRKGVADPVKIVEREEQADARLSCTAVVEFDLAEVVIAQKETSPCRGGDGNDIALTFRNQTCQWRVILEDEIHLAFEAACEALSAAAQRGALGTNMMKNAVRKGEKYILGFDRCSFHEAKEDITKRGSVQVSFWRREPCKHL